MRGTVSGIRSLYGLFKVLKCNHQHGHFCPFVYIEYYSAGDIFTKFVKCYPLARFASSRYSKLSAAFGDLRACYRGRVRITVALASAVIYISLVVCILYPQRNQIIKAQFVENVFNPVNLVNIPEQLNSKDVSLGISW